MEKTTAVQTPISYNLAWVTSFGGSRCEIFEQQWLDCASKLGLRRAEIECKFEIKSNRIELKLN